MKAAPPPCPTRRVLMSVLILLPGLALSSAQEPATPAEPAPAEPAPGKDAIATLESVRGALQVVETRLEALSGDLERANPAEKEQIETELKSLLSRRDVLRADFESIATGIDPAEYERAAPAKFELRVELDKLVRPLVEELKELTEKPREIEELRGELSTWRRRRETAATALSNLARLPAPAGGALAGDLARARDAWEERRQLADNRIGALSYQLEQAEKGQPSLYEALRDGVRSFFRSRGRNTLLCLVVVVATFFLLRFLHRRIARATPWVKKGSRPFYVRLVDVAMHLFSLVGAFVAGLLVIYATGDWVLMGFALIVLLGLALAAKSGVPKVYNHARLLLNLGEIREGERVVYNGIPWKVERLSFFSVFVNEKLRGGVLRLPVRMIGGLVSRPVCPDGEIWFPCEEGDWIELPEAGTARVVAQTPEVVQVVKLGGATVTLPTARFLESAPVNLSRGFRVSVRAGVGYRHLPEATSAIPETLWAHLAHDLHALVGERELVRSLKVEFAGASPSSLDFALIADFDGALASRYDQLERAIHRAAADCCRVHGWEIPFPQLVVHRPGDASA